jgi:hypothetical protein
VSLACCGAAQFAGALLLRRQPLRTASPCASSVTDHMWYPFCLARACGYLVVARSCGCFVCGRQIYMYMHVNAHSSYCTAFHAWRLYLQVMEAHHDAPPSMPVRVGQPSRDRMQNAVNGFAPVYGAAQFMTHACYAPAFLRCLPCMAVFLQVIWAHHDAPSCPCVWTNNLA